jgi:hypothetical protein
LDLCAHPEYVEPLRKEVEGLEFDIFMKTSKGLPLLDSFIKESTRLNPIEASMYPMTVCRMSGANLIISGWEKTGAQGLQVLGRHAGQEGRLGLCASEGNAHRRDILPARH